MFRECIYSDRLGQHAARLCPSCTLCRVPRLCRPACAITNPVLQLFRIVLNRSIGRVTILRFISLTGTPPAQVGGSAAGSMVMFDNVCYVGPTSVTARGTVIAYSLFLIYRHSRKISLESFRLQEVSNWTYGDVEFLLPKEPDQKALQWNSVHVLRIDCLPDWRRFVG